MSEINASNFEKEHGDLAPDLVGVTELTSPYFFVPPSGTTAERPEDCEPGTLRFNTDIGSLEVFRGKTIGWEQLLRREGQYLGGGTGSNTGTGTRLLIFGGNTNPGNLNNIDFATLESKGNAQDFGDLTETYPFGSDGACSSSVRALTSGANNDNVDFVTIASLGNGAAFGDYHGNMQSGACSSNTRGLFAGGYNPQPSIVDTISFFTISQLGDSVDFGNLESDNRGIASFASTTRGVFAGGTGGAPSYTNKNVIQFVTIATTGNAIEFGDLNETMAEFSGSASRIEAAFSGGSPNSSTMKNTIEFVTIATTGNAQDFGDLTAAKYHASSTSSGHGGI